MGFDIVITTLAVASAFVIALGAAFFFAKVPRGALINLTSMTLYVIVDTITYNVYGETGWRWLSMLMLLVGTAAFGAAYSAKLIEVAARDEQDGAPEPAPRRAKRKKRRTHEDDNSRIMRKYRRRLFWQRVRPRGAWFNPAAWKTARLQREHEKQQRAYEQAYQQAYAEEMRR